MIGSIESRGFIHNRLVQLAALGMSVLSVAGVAEGGGQASAAESPAAVTASASKHVLSESGQYDVASQFISGIDGSGLGTPIDIPSTITNPTVRSETLAAAELDEVGQTTNPDSLVWPIRDKRLIKEVSAISEPTIKAEAIEAIVDDTYADVLLDLSNNNFSGYQSSEESFLKTVLQLDPTQAASLESDVSEYSAVANSANSELNNPGELSEWSSNNTTLTGAWSNANTVASNFWSNIYSSAATAENAIYNKSPKTVREMKQTNAEYQAYLHQCDDLAPTPKSVCAANHAISDAQNDDPTSFATEVPFVHGATQVNRIQVAAANQAISDAKEGYQDLYDTWTPFITEPEQTARIQSSATNAAVSDAQSGFSDLAQAWESDITIPVDLAKVNAAINKAG